MKTENDFYIGWQDTAPPTFARPVRWVAISLFLLVPLVSVLLVWQQRGFSTAEFDYGQLTTLEGQLVRGPIPFLRVPVPSKTGSPTSYQRILLIGLGKHGADSTLHEWEQKHGWAAYRSLAGKTLRVRGTRLHYDGNEALELTEQAEALLTVSKTTPAALPPSVPIGTATLWGEIVDPKCFLGVMKPGDGRPHRSCAIRCIAGGLPPLLYGNDGQGKRQGYLLLGADGQPINAQLLPYVGRGVQVRGQLEQADNWLVLRVKMPITIVPLDTNTGTVIAMCQ